MPVLTSYTSLPEAIDALDKLLIEKWADLPEDVRNGLFDLRGVGTSPVDRVVNSAEFLYARRSKLPAQAKHVAAGCFRLAAASGFHGMNAGNRGELAATALEGGAAKDAPEVRPDMAPPPRQDPNDAPIAASGPIVAEEQPQEAAPPTLPTGEPESAA